MCFLCETHKKLVRVTCNLKESLHFNSTGLCLLDWSFPLQIFQFRYDRRSVREELVPDRPLVLYPAQPHHGLARQPLRLGGPTATCVHTLVV